MRLDLLKKKDLSTENTILFKLIASITAGKSIFVYSFIYASVNWHIIWSGLRAIVWGGLIIKKLFLISYWQGKNTLS